ncbi:MAG: hypothetical protein ABIT68_07275 [Sphingomicrobium sp.]
MTGDSSEVAAARIKAERARAQMLMTARALQEELEDMFSPQTWARDIWEGAKEKGADLAEEAVDAVRSRPAIASGVVAALALFFAREPLIDMAGKLAKGVQSKRKARPVKAKKTQARPRKPRHKATETIA